MKQLLMTLSTLTTLTLTSNSIINTIDVANTTVNKLLTNKLSISDSVTSLFNNQYGYLSSSDWITNQIDNNYYSYDTSHADYLLSDGKTSARTLFTVDNKGELIYKKDAMIPETKIKLTLIILNKKWYFIVKLLLLIIQLTVIVVANMILIIFLMTVLIENMFNKVKWKLILIFHNKKMLIMLKIIIV